jgi:hypothetical protein
MRALYRGTDDSMAKLSQKLLRAVDGDLGRAWSSGWEVGYHH